MFCRICGAQLEEERRYCSRCGSRVEHREDPFDCFPEPYKKDNDDEFVFTSYAPAALTPPADEKEDEIKDDVVNENAELSVVDEAPRKIKGNAVSIISPYEEGDGMTGLDDLFNMDFEDDDEEDELSMFLSFPRESASGVSDVTLTEWREWRPASTEKTGEGIDYSKIIELINSIDETEYEDEDEMNEFFSISELLGIERKIEAGVRGTGEESEGLLDFFLSELYDISLERDVMSEDDDEVIDDLHSLLSEDFSEGTPEEKECDAGEEAVFELEKDEEESEDDARCSDEVFLGSVDAEEMDLIASVGEEEEPVSETREGDDEACGPAEYTDITDVFLESVDAEGLDLIASVGEEEEPVSETCEDDDEPDGHEENAYASYFAEDDGSSLSDKACDEDDREESEEGSASAGEASCSFGYETAAVFVSDEDDADADADADENAADGSAGEGSIDDAEVSGPEESGQEAPLSFANIKEADEDPLISLIGDAFEETDENTVEAAPEVQDLNKGAADDDEVDPFEASDDEVLEPLVYTPSKPLSAPAPAMNRTSITKKNKKDKDKDKEKKPFSLILIAGPLLVIIGLLSMVLFGGVLSGDDEKTEDNGPGKVEASCITKAYGIEVTLTSDMPSIVYTIDGTTPVLTSETYTMPVVFSQPGEYILQAAATDGVTLGKVYAFSYEIADRTLGLGCAVDYTMSSNYMNERGEPISYQISYKIPDVIEAGSNISALKEKMRSELSDYYAHYAKFSSGDFSSMSDWGLTEWTVVYGYHDTPAGTAVIIDDTMRFIGDTGLETYKAFYYLNERDEFVTPNEYVSACGLTPEQAVAAYNDHEFVRSGQITPVTSISDMIFYVESDGRVVPLFEKMV